MKCHPIEQSPFFKMGSPQRLAKVLGVDLNRLEEMANRPAAENYNLFSITRDDKKRSVQEPKVHVQRLHMRVCDLLTRIEPPEYLHSAIKRRSYLTNARAHVVGGGAVKVDVRKFFPSVTQRAVRGFFLGTMQCAPDVAALLSKLLTVDGHLATGSSVSPILSFYAHRQMFEEIAALTQARGLVMTCYVDDLSFTGEGATRKFLSEVRTIIARHGLISHKVRYFSARTPRVITGVVVSKDGLKLPNRRHRKINEEYAAFQHEADISKKLSILTPLIGRVHEAAQIDGRWISKARELVRRQRDIRKELKQGNHAAASVPFGLR